MKIEPRGKYAGVKVHLDPEECEAFMKMHADLIMTGCYKGSEPSLKDGFIAPHTSYFSIAAKIGKSLTQLIKDNPNLLHDRTEDEIMATLSKEAIESKLKLDAIGKGADWTKVKVEVVK